MPLTQIPIDGLWRCLCPSIDAITISLYPTSMTAVRKFPTRHRTHSKRLSRRNFHTSIRNEDQPPQSSVPPRRGPVDSKSAFGGWNTSFGSGSQWQIPSRLSKQGPEGHPSLPKVPDPEKDKTIPAHERQGLQRPAAVTNIWEDAAPEARKKRRQAAVQIETNTNVYPGQRTLLYETPPQIKKYPVRHPVRIMYSEKNAAQPKKNETEDIPVTHLHDRLRKIRTWEGAYYKILFLVQKLITVRGLEPALIHYDALIRANADAENGSANAVRSLLKEMKTEGIGADSGLYHAALQVLAIHPDYLLRNEIIQEMKERWFGLSPEGWHCLVVGLLRDRQYEMAMDKIEQMRSDQIQIQPWLYDIFTYNLIEIGEIDEAFKMLRHRFEHEKKDISPSLWYFLLDTFSSNFHYDGTRYIWKSRVVSNFINPSDGMCVNALNVAARNADPSLATSAIRILSSRRTALSPYHYEALLAAYTGSRDLSTAFRILGIIQKAGFEPDAAMTRPLFAYLIGHKSLPFKAWEVLQTLSQEGHTIHITAINVVIEACLHIGEFNRALDMYKELHTICEAGPSIETFNTLLQAAARVKAKDSAMFLASEMIALDIKPDFLTYDRLILLCLNEDDYEDSFRYLEEMEDTGKEKFENGQKGWWMRRGTASTMARKCARAGDGRCWTIIAEMEKRGMDVGKVKPRVEELWAKLHPNFRIRPEANRQMAMV